MPRTRQSDPLLTQTAFEKFNLIDLIPMYDGGESLGIRRFLGKINDVANLGKWSNDEKVTILKLKLTGIAEESFLSDPTHSQLTEYNDIARILIEDSKSCTFINASPIIFIVYPGSFGERTGICSTHQ
ncbi:hypothetical protein TNCV_2888281 [Trichonephila clavipes]|nr:hypothetical protein TNCV_2888281 [Trichonephila clavipes]